MEYRQLGRAGVRVSTLTLGAMNFGGRTSKKDSVKIIDRALDAGINLIDTANVYGDGRSEEIVGEAIAGRREDVLVATKVFGSVGPGPNDHGASRFHIFREVDRSLQRLGTDWIDLYQLHRPDMTTMFHETLAALDDLVHSGKVRYVGFSTFPAWMTAWAQGLAEARGFVRIATEQPPYNLLERGVEREVLPAAGTFGMGILPWSPLAGGLLAERFRRGKAPKGARASELPLDAEHWVAVREAVERLGEVAAEAGTSLERFALAWLRDAPGVTAPIIGPRTQKQLDDALASLDVTVDEDARRAVDEVVPPGQGVWMSARERDREG